MLCAAQLLRTSYANRSPRKPPRRFSHRVTRRLGVGVDPDVSEAGVEVDVGLVGNERRVGQPLLGARDAVPPRVIAELELLPLSEGVAVQPCVAAAPIVCSLTFRSSRSPRCA